MKSGFISIKWHKIIHEEHIKTDSIIYTFNIRSDSDFKTWFYDTKAKIKFSHESPAG